MLKLQGGTCAICKRPPDAGLLVVDHDHVDKRVRGLIHRKCNSGIGMLGDDFFVVQSAAEYLRPVSPAPNLTFEPGLTAGLLF